MATATERKFTSLRKRLDQMGYRQPLVIDSLPLAEKLFADLMHTTESFKNAKLQLGKHKEQKGVWERHVEPYRTDNARLVKENSELHQQLLKLKETNEQRAKDLKIALRRLDHENSDLKFLNTQYMQRLMTQEKENLSKTEKILELQEKNFQAVIQTPGGRKKSIPFRRQRMDIDSTLSSANSTKEAGLPRGLPPADPYIADLLGVADQRIVDLQAAIVQGDKDRKDLEQSLHSLRKQIDNREYEIGRLNSLLKGGRPPEALAAEGAKETNERMVAHLNIQIDFLQQANHELEKKLSSAEANNKELDQRVIELSNKNSRICSELLEIGGLVKQMESERGSNEDDLKQTVKQLQSQLDSEKERQSVLELRVSDLLQETNELRLDNRKMAEMLATYEGEGQEYADKMERLSEDNKTLKKQCHEYRNKESLLRHQISTFDDHSSTTNSVELSKLKRERDELKNAVTTFEAELIEIQTEANTLAEDRDNFKLLYEQVSDQVSRLRQQSRGPAIASGAAMIRRLESDRDDAHMELRQVKAESQSLKTRLKAVQTSQQTDLKALEDRCSELQLQLDEVGLERDELVERVSTMRNMIKSLEAELRDSSSSLSAANSEVAHYRGKATQLQGLLDSMEKTRQTETSDRKKQMTNISDAKLNVAQLNSKIVKLEGQLRERDDKVLELRQALASLDKHHDELLSEANGKSETIERLQSKLEGSEEDLGKAHNRLFQVEGDLTVVQGQMKERVREIAGLQSQFEGRGQEVDSFKEQCGWLQKETAQLKDDLNTMTQQCQALRDEFHRATQENSSLKQKVQEYTQTILRCEETIAVKEQEKKDLLESYRSLSEEANKLDSSVQTSLGENSTARLELSTVLQEKKHLEGLLAQQEAEIKQHRHSLQAYELQLSNMTHSLSKYDAALRQAQGEKAALIGDLEATKDLCVQIQKTKESLQRQISSQSVAYDQVQTRLQDLESERDLLKQQLVSERKNVDSLQGLLSSERKKEFHTHKTSQEQTEEIQHLQQQLARLEADRLTLTEQVRTLRVEAAQKCEEIQRLTSELASEKFQSEHNKQQQQLQAQRVRVMVKATSTPPLTHSQSLELATATPTIITTHTNTAQQELQEGEELFSKERESLVAESARLVGELLSTSTTSITPSHSTPSHSPPNTSTANSQHS